MPKAVEIDFRDVFVKTYDGYYKSKMEWEPAPERPAGSSKRISECKAEEVQAFVELLKEYEKDKAAWEERRKLARDDQYRLEALFRDDVLRHYGFEPDDPLGSAIYSQAWEDGHSAGLSEVLGYYSDLADRILPVIKEHYVKKEKAVPKPEAKEPPKKSTPKAKINPPKKFQPPD